MTTKQILKLTDIMSRINESTKELVKGGFADRKTISSIKSNLSAYKEYTSLKDGGVYYSSEISIEEQTANFFAGLGFKNLSNCEVLHHRKILSDMLGISASLVSRKYGKSNDNLFLYDESKEIEILKLLDKYTNQDSKELLKKFSRIEDGIVKSHGTRSSFMDERNVHTLYNIYMCMFDLLDGDEITIENDDNFYSEMYYLNCSKAILPTIEVISEKYKLKKKFVCKMWFVYFLKEKDVCFSQDLGKNVAEYFFNSPLFSHKKELKVIQDNDIEFPNVVYYKTNLQTMSDECKWYFLEQVNSGKVCSRIKKRD